jgi:hypothetical protein
MFRIVETGPYSPRPVQTLLRLTQTEPRSTPIFKSGRVGEPNRNSMTGALSGDKRPPEPRVSLNQRPDGGLCDVVSDYLSSTQHLLYGHLKVLSSSFLFYAVGFPGLWFGTTPSQTTIDSCFSSSSKEFWL